MKNLFLFFLLSLSAFGETTYPMKELSALYKEAKSNRHKADANREIIRKGLEIVANYPDAGRSRPMLISSGGEFSFRQPSVFTA